jgi:hypothetical protein
VWQALDWLEPWTSIESGDAQRALEAELWRELGAGHPLVGLVADAIGKRSDQDDVLFALRDGRVAEIHLTWSGRSEANPQWPRTTIYPTADAWVEQRMKPLHVACTGSPR